MPTSPLVRTASQRLLVRTCMLGSATLLVLYPEALAAQGEMRELLDLYESQMGSFRATARGIASKLFLSLALLEAIVTAYTLSFDEQVGIDTIFRRLAFKAVVLGFIYLLLLRPDLAIDPLLRGIEKVGADIGGHGVKEPADILAAGTGLVHTFTLIYEIDIDRGLDPSWLSLGALITAFFSQLMTGIIMVVVMLVFMLAFMVLAGQLILARIKLYIALSVGLFFAGFASFRATAGMPEAWLRYGAQLSIHLFMIQVMLGFADQMFPFWSDYLMESFERICMTGELELPGGSMCLGVSTTYVHPGRLFQLLGSVLLFTYLSWKLPVEIASRVAGDLRFGLSEAVRGR